MDVDGKINESVTILENSSYFKKFMVTKKDYIENAAKIMDNGYELVISNFIRIFENIFF